MILILSSTFDKTTNSVIDWLKSDFIRVNNEKCCAKLKLSFNSQGYEASISLIDDTIINVSRINAFWYRRDDFNFYIDTNHLEKSCHIERNLENEWNEIKNFIHHCCVFKRSISSYDKEVFHNKLTCLALAQQVGFNIPQTLITTQKSDLLAFVRLHGNCITKTASNMFKIRGDYFSQTIGTQIVTEQTLNKLSKNIFPTLVQKKIEKIFELRIFYFNTVFYSMAIFSQNDEKTQLDYRNYNREKPNRCISYKLPIVLQEKLFILIRKLELNTCSIDMMVTSNDEYIFLEINPVGQFGWVSENCNYYLEEKIAHFLQNES